jgi:hypothetical protein
MRVQPYVGRRAPPRPCLRASDEASMGQGEDAGQRSAIGEVDDPARAERLAGRVALSQVEMRRGRGVSELGG